MQTLIFDIETNAIDNFATLEGLKEILCISTLNPSSGIIESYSGDGVEEGLRSLELADVIVGHNIVKFDIPAIQVLYPDWEPQGLVRDTLLLSRLFDTNLMEQDNKKGRVSRRLLGNHSLKAWGQRLGEHKGDYGSTDEAFNEWSQELEDYCEQDVRVTSLLYTRFSNNPAYDKRCVQLEHDFAAVIRKQELNGFGFDSERAKELHADLLGRRLELQDSLSTLFEPREVVMKTPQYYQDPETDMKYDKKGDAPQKIRCRLAAGPPKVKVIPFNPNSRDQIANGLIDKYGWKPASRTPTGQPKVDETTLGALDYPEAKIFAEYLMLGKRLGQLSDGKEAWLKVEKDGRIHGEVVTNGAVTGRCTHRKPNLAQVPSIHAPYGEECRSLFIPSPGYTLLGVDASGLELRCLAHYMGRHDKGEYAKVILEGDIHTTNQEAAGLETRNQAKTFIYAFLYGAGDAKIGSIVGGDSSKGRALKERFLRKTPALKQLKAEVERVVERFGYLTGLDGRPLHVRSAHSALNTLLQSAGAVLMKQATVLAAQRLADFDIKQVAHIHDEIQYEVREDQAHAAGEIVCGALETIGESLRCPLAGEYRVGSNWAETH